MLDFVGRLIGWVIQTTVKSALSRARLKIICGWGNELNSDGVGNYLGLWVKIINPTSSSIYFERLEALDQSGKVFFPLLKFVQTGDEILPRRNIVGIIPCGHVTRESRPKALIVYDSTEQKHTINSRMLRKVVAELEAERKRQEDLGFNVHPTRP